MNLSRLFFFCLTVTFCAIGTFGYNLWDFNEILVAEISREFLDHMMWAIPTLNGDPFLEKPPLVYWITAVFFKAFGVKDSVARIPAFLFSLGTLFFTYLLGKNIGKNEKMGFLSVFLLATMGGFFLFSREILTDTGLLFFTMGAIFFLYMGANRSPTFYPFSFLFALGAFFCKGFIGMAIPGITFLSWIFLTRRKKELLRTRFWVWLPLTFIPIILWMRELLNYPGEDLLRVFLIHNHLYRFFPDSPEYRGGHSEPFFFYFKYLPLLSLPWIFFILFRLKELWKEKKESSVSFLLCWFLAGFIFFSLAGTKRPVYLLPLLPSLAILCAWIQRNNMESLFKGVICLSIGLIFLLLILMPEVNRRWTTKPVLKEIAPIVKNCEKIYVFRPQEILLSSIPFYLGRYILPIKDEEELKRVHGISKDSCVIVMDEYGAEKRRSEVVKRYFQRVLYEGRVPVRRKLTILSKE